MRALPNNDSSGMDTDSPAATGGWWVLVRALCSLAFGISGYLLWGSLSGERLPGCGVASGCGTVLSSRWAYVFGVPVSLPALVLYASVLGATFLFTGARSVALCQGAWAFLICAAASLVGAAIWFIGLQVWAIKAICPFCMVAHGCGLLAGALILAKTLRSKLPSGPGVLDHQCGMTQPIRKAMLALTGLAAAGLLAAGQWMHEPKSFAVDSAGKLAARKAPRILQLHGGAFQLDLSDVPLIGSPEAPCVIVHLFDYSCPHCRQLHPILNEIHHRFSNHVAIASLLVPLATNCNRVVKRVMPAHVNACDYAYAGLAVWRARPELLPAFEDWIFTPEKPPPPETARAYAMKLAGTNEFQSALTNAWIKTHLERNISLYETNYYRFRKSVLPELIVGTNIVSGVVRGADDLHGLITNQFAF